MVPCLSCRLVLPLIVLVHVFFASYVHDGYYCTVLKPVVVRAVCHRSSDGAKVKSGSTRAASEIDGVACKHPRHKLTYCFDLWHVLGNIYREYKCGKPGYVL